MAPPVQIRPFHADDVDRAQAIWMQRPGAPSVVSADDASAHRSWFAELPRSFAPFGAWTALVDDAIAGWTSLLPCRNNPALRGTMAECSVYVEATLCGRGIGPALLAAATRSAATMPLEWLVAYTAKSNERAEAMFARVGWERVGDLPVPQANLRRSAVTLWRYDVGASR